MGRTRVTFYVDKVPGQPLKGRGWIDISDFEVAKRHEIPLIGEHTNPHKEIEVSLEFIKTNGIQPGAYASFNSSNRKIRHINKFDRGIHYYCRKDGTFVVVIACKRGKAGGKKFTVLDRQETVKLSVQKSLTVKAVCTWVRTWASEEAEIITPGGKTISLDGDNLTTTEYIYFIHSEASNALKIGRAKNVEKRLKSLQTAHPHELKVIKTFKVKGGKAAKELENSLHQKFDHLRLLGEWFKAKRELFDFEF